MCMLSQRMTRNGLHFPYNSGHGGGPAQPRLANDNVFTIWTDKWIKGRWGRTGRVIKILKSVDKEKNAMYNTTY